MNRVFWSLFYDRDVTAYLRSLRGTEVGQTLHKTIVALQFEADPSVGHDAIPERPNRYFVVVANHRITIEIRPDRKAIGILLIERANFCATTWKNC